MSDTPTGQSVKSESPFAALPPRCESCGRRTDRVEFCFGIGFTFGNFCYPRCA